MGIQKEQMTFTFSFKSGEGLNALDFTFNIVASSREEALERLRAHLATIINDINADLKEKKDGK